MITAPGARSAPALLAAWLLAQGALGCHSPAPPAGSQSTTAPTARITAAPAATPPSAAAEPGGAPGPRSSSEPRAASGSPQPSGFALAVTVDDLPWVGRTRLPETRAEATTRLVGAFRQHAVPAVGFVTCDSVRIEPAVLDRWVEAGLELGNHTARHRDLDGSAISAWLGDVDRCHAELEHRLGKPPRFFRHPYLHYGATLERKHAAEQHILGMGYRLGHVTIVSHDWLFAAAYGESVRHKTTAEADAVVDELVAHVLEATRRARAESRTRFGREIAQVLLLHANLLLADDADRLLAALAQEGARFVTLGEALDDPVYALPDRYLGPHTFAWLDRIAPPPEGEPPWDAQQDRLLTARYRWALPRE
jgi:peptidoglycan/xylan/chitin deacetylase (PgdA/CDA1 family)